MKKSDAKKLIKQWQDAVAFNYQKAAEDPSDAGYRNGYAAAMSAAVSDLTKLLEAK